MEYLTVRETSEKWGMSIRMVNYYLNTGALQTLRDLYPKIQKHLDIWHNNNDGTLKCRKKVNRLFNTQQKVL